MASIAPAEHAARVGTVVEAVVAGGHDLSESQARFGRVERDRLHEDRSVPITSSRAQGMRGD